MTSLLERVRGLIKAEIDTASPAQMIEILDRVAGYSPAPRAVPSDLQGQRFTRLGSDGKPTTSADYVAVQDCETGLVWMRNSLGEARVPWQQAIQAATAIDLCGWSDWRLPTIKELLSIVDYGRHDPVIDPVFNCEAAWYWSATPYASSPAVCAWLVGFYNGGANWYDQNGSGYVRAVRAGQIVGVWPSNRR